MEEQLLTVTLLAAEYARNPAFSKQLWRAERAQTINSTGWKRQKAGHSKCMEAEELSIYTVYG